MEINALNDKKTKILVVDDEEDILRLLDYNLRKAGFKVLVASDGPEALKTANRENPALIILDVMLPDMEGTEVLRRLKSNERLSGIPVMMLTAKGEEMDRVVGLELGAEDYITKPFSPRELLLRIRAVLRRGAGPGQEEKVFSFRELRIDFPRHKVTVDGREAALSATEFRLLKELAGASGRVLSRDALLDRAWGTECHVTPRTVDAHVRRLRTKLKNAGAYIETVRGAGYRFVER